MSWHHADWLSFAQALVAAVAIAGAYGVVFLQHRLEKNREANKERAEARRILSIAAAFTSKATTAVGLIAELRTDTLRTETEADRVRQSADLHQALEALVSLPIHIIPTFVAAEQLMRARSELADACRAVVAKREGNGHIDGSAEYGAQWLKWEARLAEATKKIRAELIRFEDDGNKP
ncbi:hypothetical protein [Paraburkholderia sp. J94]|uniref:hypothetical protein n=1 Tax=Paraburkholderia sp. J94 TaxID=2805441 RepID=UPI002AAF6F6A|nr:hypothetical protein [Paraburkholderia sp. J94]